MGRIAIMPQRWEQNGLYLLKTANLEIGSNYYRNATSNTQTGVIFGGLPMFSNGRVGFVGEVLNSSLSSLVYFGIRLQKTTTILSYERFALGYTVGGVWNIADGLTFGYMFCNGTFLGRTAGVANLFTYNCYGHCSGNQLTVNVNGHALTVTDSTYASGHLGVSIYNGTMYYPAIDFGGTNPVWPTTNIAYLRFRVMRNNNPVSGAKVVAVHHKIADMMISNSTYPLPVLDKIGIAHGITGPDGWVEIPLDTDDGPWIVSVSYYDGQTQTWCTAEVKPAEMPTLYV